jgi:tetratricopeptide (TPR) repeat protein
VLALVGLAAAAVYVFTIEYDFVWDDVTLVAENAYIRSFGFVGEYFRRDYAVLSHGSLSIKWYYRPLLALSFLTDYQVWRANPAGFHLTNVLLHLVSSLLVALLAGRLSGCAVVAALAGLFFAVHPVHVEPVAFVAGRVDSLVTAFVVAAIVAVLMAQRRRGAGRLLWHGMGCLAAAAAMLSKETGALGPGLVFLCLTWHARQGGASWRAAALSGVRQSGPTLGVLALNLVVRQALFPVPVSPSDWTGGPGLWPRVMTGMYLGGRAIGVTTVGFPWQPLYQMEFLHRLGAETLAGGIVLTGAAWATWRSLARGSVAGVGGAWFLVVTLPFLNVIPIPGGRAVYFAERFLYLPSVGVALAAGTLGAAALAMLDGWRRRAAVAAMAVGLLCLGVTTTLRSETWRDNPRLFQAMRERSPDSTLPVANLALTRLETGRPAEALALIGEVFERIPTDRTALVVMGRAHLALGRTDEGLAYLRKAVEHHPNNPWLLNLLGAALGQAGRPGEAMPYLERALTADPLFPPALMNLGLVRAQDARPDDALRLFRTALALRPDWPDPQVQIGRLFLEQGRPEEALVEFQAALRIDARHPVATWALATTLDRLDRRPEARAAWERLRDLPGAEPYASMVAERLR